MPLCERMLLKKVNKSLTFFFPLYGILYYLEETGLDLSMCTFVSLFVLRTAERHTTNSRTEGPLRNQGKQAAGQKPRIIYI